MLLLRFVMPLAVSGCAFAAAQPGPALALMPMPERVAVQQGTLAIDSRFTVAISGYSDRRLDSAVIRLVARISRMTGIPIEQRVAGNGVPATLVVECGGASPETPALDEDESYQLDISPTGGLLKARTVTGALRGMATFAQLVTPAAASFTVPAVRIGDRPRFPWRGLMIDVSRHWMPAPVLERNLRAMAAVKLNVLHWHLSDDQGFRVESKRFPRLQQYGSDGHFYTQDQVRHIIAYARARGIRVVPEFDIPGHTTSWFAGYPDLASAPGPYQIERKWGIFVPTMDPTREAVYTFLDAFIGEMADLFPDEYFHIGGDEVLDTQWKQNPSIVAFCRRKGIQPGHELQTYFNQRVQALVQKHGKKMIGWDEILHPGLPTDAVIQSWRGQQSLAEAARKGYRGILSFGYYLDHLQPAAFHYAVDPLGGAARDLSRQDAARILGGETCMWDEYTTAETVDSRIWPRAAAIAERLWSPQDTRDVDSMYARLAIVSRGLDWLGVQHRSNYLRMLERLSGGQSTEALQVLADAVEAQGIDVRQKARYYTSETPLNRLVDAARPESESVRVLTAAVKKLQADPQRASAERTQIRLKLAEWRDNHARLLPELENFLLQEAAPLSQALSQLGSIGLQSLGYLETGKQAPGPWVRRQKALLARMEKPQAEVALAAVRPVQILVEAAARSRTGN